MNGKITWEEAEKLYPGIKDTFICWCSTHPDLFTLLFSHAFGKRDECIEAYETTKLGKQGCRGEMYRFANDAWEKF